MSKHLVVFVEREWISEEGLKKSHRLYGYLENERGKILHVLVE
jgi:hypothetical protein